MELVNSQRYRRYKGNVHLHSTISDGKFTPEQAADWYRRRGYDFIAFTDHNALTDARSLQSDGFLCIPGVEVGVDYTELQQSYHLVALGLATLPFHEHWRPIPVQTAIDELNTQGAIVILAHPYWSGLTVAEMMPLQGIAGVEVYNTSADRDLGKGLSAVQWDDVLVRGKRWWGLATDDAHWVDNDAGEGWIMVEAETLSEQAILAALRAGRFYSSSGPDILSLSREGDMLTVTCSPVVTINVSGHTQWGRHSTAEPGSTLTEGAYRIRGFERYLPRRVHRRQRPLGVEQSFVFVNEFPYSASFSGVPFVL